MLLQLLSNIIYSYYNNLREGEHFISGGEDKEVKVWGYDEGICSYTGAGHSGSITRVHIILTYSIRSS